MLPQISAPKNLRSLIRGLLFGREALDGLVVVVVVDVEHEGARVKVDAVLRVRDLQTAPNSKLLNRGLEDISAGQGSSFSSDLRNNNKLIQKLEHI